MTKEMAPKSRRESLVIQEMNGEVLVYDLVENKAFCLNQTSAMVWQACDGRRTIAEIGEAVGQQLDSQVNEDMVWLALDQLSKENLVEKQTAINHKFSGLSRREVIRKIGLASVIALPLITSLVAPQAIHAASTCGITSLCDCGNNGSPLNCGQRTCSTGCTCTRLIAGVSSGTCK